MTTTETDLTIANIILDQLGGARRLNIMTGARDFLAIDDGLMFSIGRNAERVNRIEIKLNALDTYDVRLMNISTRRAFDDMVQIKSEVGGVYCDQLAGVIERGTGMALSL